MTRPPRRVLLGAESGIADRCRVYRTAEALEVDLIDHYNIQRRRVFFDEVQLVTLHSRRGVWRASLGFTLLALAAGLMGVSMAGYPWQNFLFGTAFGLALLAVMAAFAQAWVVTVFGRRTRARMSFSFRPARARRVYAEICQAAATAQAAVSASDPTTPPAPPEPLPMPPEPDSPP
jgi:hypothetical protein